MKALSLTQSWATACVRPYYPDGTPLKKVETRSWQTTYRGELAIHAAKGFPGYAKEFAAWGRVHGHIPIDLPRMAIIGVVNLVRIMPTQDIKTLDALEQEYGDYSAGRFGWFFEDARELPEPIPCKGALSLWTVPTEIEAQIRLELLLPEAMERMQTALFS